MARPSKLPPLTDKPPAPSVFTFSFALTNAEAKRLRAAAQHSGVTPEEFIKDCLRDVTNGLNNDVRWLLIGLLPEHMERWEARAEQTGTDLGQLIDTELGFRLEELEA